ncbi:MAG: hypothetical protein GY953_52595 [bacterium]|nr:hypothetical protein [bacterium]
MAFAGRLARRSLAAFGAALCLWGCADAEGEDTLTVPRGATLSIRTTEAIATNTHDTGDGIQGEIDVPLRRGTTIFVPLLARVEGVVSSVTIDKQSRNRISLQLTALHLPNGDVVSLETVPLVRQAKSELQTEDITVRTGLDIDIDLLLGNEDESVRRRNQIKVEALAQLTIPTNSHLVFTLEKDIIIPAP